MTNYEAVLGRIRYAWIHADRAMDKIDPPRRETVREIFAGTRRPTSLMLALIADATGRTVDWFLHGDGDEESRARFAFDAAEGLQRAMDESTVSAMAMGEESSHVFVPTGGSTCAVCKLSVHAETHGSYPQVCTECGHATPHHFDGLSGCEFDDCMCDRALDPDDQAALDAQNQAFCEAAAEISRIGQEIDNAKPTVGEVLHLCDRCHGEVYTFPQKVISMAQRMHLGYWAAFTYKDDEGSELLVYPHKGTVLIDINGEVIRIPLDTLEAVVEALRVSGLRAVEGDPS